MKLSPLTKYLTYQFYNAIHLVCKIETDGDVADIHQFRVTLRRARSLLKLYLGDSAAFPPLLKDSLKKTNSLRELDVLLSTLAPENYPKTLKRLNILRQEHFASIFTDTFKQDVIRVLHNTYDELYKLNPNSKPEEWIKIAEEHYDVCVDHYYTLSENATQKELHALRIEFKTARYGLEFLRESTLANEDEKIKECERYQDILGAIQDTFNQLSWLKKFYKEYPIKEIKKLIRKRREMLKALKKARVSNRSA
jgi:CHAD domain-containing protein